MPPDDGLQLVSASPSAQEAAFERMAQNEIAVIAGAIYGGPEAVLRASAMLAPDSFYLEAHRLIFEAAVALAGRAIRPDLVTITDELRVHGRLGVAGGIAGVDSVIHAFATAENVPVYCRLLRSSAGRRRISSACDAASHGARNGTTTEEILRLLQHVQQEGEVFASDSVNATLVTYVDFSQELPAMDWIVPGWLVRQDIAIMAGEAGIGKSTTLAALALAIATGKTWCGVDVCSPLRVLYFDEEQSLPEVHRLFQRLGAPSENLRVAVGQGLNFSTPQGLQRLENEIRDFHPDVVFFDSLTHALLGIPENNANEVAKVYSESILRLRRDYDLAFVFSHHLSKPPGDSRTRMSDLQRVRGSTAHTAQCSTVWVATSADGKLEVRQAKRRGAAQIGLRIAYSDAADGTIQLTGEPTIAEHIRTAKILGQANRERVRLFILGSSRPVTRVEVQNETGFSKSTVCDHLTHLVEAGAILVAKDGRFERYSSPDSSDPSDPSDPPARTDSTLWETDDYGKDA